jgi:hydrogenase maturation protein HypF
MTTMASFEMCPACRSEYENPLDRRFHAQPIACPACGPKIWLERGQKRVGDFDRVEVIKSARKMLEEGLILAIKGLGGFHLACDATKTDVVEKLRQRKLRRDKPFALMMPDLETVSEHCELDANQRELLSSNARPIVILTRRDSSSIAAAAAPGQNTLGVMLPYTPLHTLLLAGETARVLVMTSGNLAEEPIAHLNEDAQTRLAPLADAFLMHDRDIHVRCDDSVFRIAIRGRPSPLRRSRGYSPDPIIMPVKTIPVFASGAELKNTFCMTRENYAFMSHHIGDLENYETLRSFEEGVSHFENLFRIQIQALAHDLHPNYLATRYVLARSEADNIPALGVQHHHAHIAACMAENGLSGERPVIGVAFDGTGYGTDGKIWGGEFLIADYDRCERVNHLDYLPLPGGDLAIREPWRVALAALRSCGFRWEDNLPPVFGRESKVLSVLDKQLDTGINLAWTSSMGRLFDAAAALMGVRQTVNYEAQAAIELEHLVDSIEPGAYRFGFTVGGLIDPVPVFNQIIEDLRNEQPIPIMSARFHNGIAEMVLDNCLMLRARYGLNQVALSGGVWQNNVLLSKTALHLENAGFEVLYHHIVPANDGGLSLGQAVIAAHYFTK